MGAAAEYVIQGRPVALPVEVRDASAATSTFLVDAAAAGRLLPGNEVELVELVPGRALLSIGCIDYRDNDLGDYHEISIAFFVRARGVARGLPLLGPLAAFARGDLATWIQRLPVDQSFTCDAGRRIWGFPKTVDEISVRREAGRVACEWVAEGRPVLRYAAPARGGRRMPDRTLTTWSWIDGKAHRTAFTSGADGVGFRLGGAALELGSHPIADELRALGLPRRALMSVWMEHMHGRFEAARPA